MKFIAHRGLDNHKYYENTKDALIESLNKDYIDGVELDIRLTCDNKFVIYHNSSYIYLGVRKFIKGINYKDIINDNLGSLKEPRYINGLEEVLSSIKTNKIILLEIKHESKDYQVVITEINRIIDKYHYLNIWLCSFNYNLVNELTSKSKCNVGLIISDIINKNKDISKFDFVSLSKNAFNDIKTDKIKMAWTINSKKDLDKLRGSDYIITDKAYLLE